MMSRLAAALLCLSLAACAASGPPPAEYLLTFPEPPAGELAGGGQASHLYVSEVRLADYLAVSGIVYQTDPNQVHTASRHRWAEPLQAQLRHGLRNVLTLRLGETALVPAVTRDADRLEVFVDTFQGRFDGAVRVAGEWRLHGPGGELLTGRRFRVTVPLEEDGYPALVRALSTAWVEVAEDVAAGYAAR